MLSVNKKIWLMILVGIFLVSSVSAALTFEQSEEVDLKITCINAGFCTAAAQCNVSVFSPSQVTLLNGVEATQSASLAFHNITLNSTQTSQLGTYSVAGFCKDGSVTQLIDFEFEITETGFALTTSIAILYFLMLVLSVVVLTILVWASFIIPFKNQRDGEGFITVINHKKMFKILSIAGSYLTLMWIVALLHAVSRSFLPLALFKNFFLVFYRIMLAGFVPALVFTIALIIAVAISDFNLRKILERGLKVR